MTFRLLRAMVALWILSLTGGCAVIAVADTAATVAIKGAGLVVDGAVGAVKLTGKAAGAAVGAVLPSGEK